MNYQLFKLQFQAIKYNKRKPFFMSCCYFSDRRKYGQSIFLLVIPASISNDAQTWFSEHIVSNTQCANTLVLPLRFYWYVSTRFLEVRIFVSTTPFMRPPIPVVVFCPESELSSNCWFMVELPRPLPASDISAENLFSRINFCNKQPEQSCFELSYSQ